mgnify:CR=1 FL=1
MKNSELITSKDNPSIKLYRKLSDSKKARKENGLFVLEGARLCFDSSALSMTKLLIITETAYEKYDDKLSEIEKNIIKISDELGNKLSDTINTQGVFSVCKIPEKTRLCDFMKSGEKYIVLNSLQDPLNIGTIIRTADALGINGVILCKCCDLYNPKVIRGTMGSVFRIKTIEADFEDVISEFKTKNITSFAAIVDKSAKSLTECDFSDGCAAIIGNEGNGLSENDIELCDEKITIKMQGSIESFNASTAATIILWEMSK